MQDPTTGLVIDRAERYQTTARPAMENGDPESAASRAYYALYHMTILLSFEISAVAMLVSYWAVGEERR